MNRIYVLAITYIIHKTISQSNLTHTLAVLDDPFLWVIRNQSTSSYWRPIDHISHGRQYENRVHPDLQAGAN